MILVVFGPGGVGKGSLVGVLRGLDDGLWLSRSWTTRARRPGEVAEAYVFVDEADFRRRIDEGGFLEWARFESNGCLYGTPLPTPPGGKDVLLEIDLVGARAVKERYPDAVLVLVVAPSPEVAEERMRTRGDGEAEIARRLRLGGEEEAAGRALADHVVVNDDLSRAAGEVAGIVERHRAKEPPT